MCPHCNYNPDWQARGEETPPEDYEGNFFEGPTLTRADNQTRTLYGCPKCKGVWIDW